MGLEKLEALLAGWGEWPWRVGRQVGRTIYRQVDAEPSDIDHLIGVLDTREEAALAVAAVNALPDLLAAARALEFYADEKTYTQMTSWGGRILDPDGPWKDDTGKRARSALARLGAKGEA